jgi:hypothetical protein
MKNDVQEQLLKKLESGGYHEQIYKRFAHYNPSEEMISELVRVTVERDSALAAVQHMSKRCEDYREEISRLKHVEIRMLRWDVGDLKNRNQRLCAVLEDNGIEDPL